MLRVGREEAPSKLPLESNRESGTKENFSKTNFLSQENKFSESFRYRNIAEKDLEPPVLASKCLAL